MKTLAEFKVNTKYKDIHSTYTCVWITRQGNPVLVEDTEEYAFVVHNPDRFEEYKPEKWVNIYWEGTNKNYPQLSRIYGSQTEAINNIIGSDCFYIKTIQLE